MRSIFLGRSLWVRDRRGGTKRVFLQCWSLLSLVILKNNDGYVNPLAPLSSPCDSDRLIDSPHGSLSPTQTFQMPMFASQVAELLTPYGQSGQSSCYHDPSFSYTSFLGLWISICPQLGLALIHKRSTDLRRWDSLIHCVVKLFSPVGPTYWHSDLSSLVTFTSKRNTLCWLVVV